MTDSYGTAMLTVDTPQNVGCDPARWQHLLNMVHGWTATEEVPAAGLLVARKGIASGG